MKQRALFKFFLYTASGLFCWTTPCLAISLNIEIKQALSGSKTLIGADPYIFSRSYLGVRPSSIRRGPWRLESDVQIHYFSGDYLDTSEWQSLTFSRLQGSNALDWEGVWDSSDGGILLARAYRFYGALSVGSWEFLAGRMRNAMGNSRVFVSVLDRFDALPTMVSESLERPGSDTAKARWRYGDSLKIEGAYCWDQEASRYRSYVQAQGLLTEGLEGSFLAGELAPSTRGIGGSLEWSLWQGELRWEGTFNEIKEEEYYVEIVGITPVLRSQITRREFKRHLIHWERTYAQEWLVAVEYLHNGLGAGDAQNYDLTRLLRGEDLYLAKKYAGAHVGRTISPLWSFSMQGFSNISDGTFAWMPELTFLSPGSSLEVEVRLQRSFGPSSGEYSQLPNRNQLLATWHF